MFRSSPFSLASISFLQLQFSSPPFSIWEPEYSWSNLLFKKVNYSVSVLYSESSIVSSYAWHEIPKTSFPSHPPVDLASAISDPLAHALTLSKPSLILSSICVLFSYHCLCSYQGQTVNGSGFRRIPHASEQLSPCAITIEPENFN